MAEEVFGFDAYGVRRIVQTIRKVNADPRLLGNDFSGTHSANDVEHILPGVNNTGGPLAPFSVVKITSGSVLGGNYYASFTKQDGTLYRELGLTGAETVAANEATGVHVGVGIGKYTGTAPTVGQSCGPASGSTVLTAGLFGFRCLGIIDSTNQLGIFSTDWPSCYFGKTSTLISKGSSGTVDLYKDATTTSGASISALALGAEIKANKWCVVQYFGGVATVAPWEC